MIERQSGDERVQSRSVTQALIAREKERDSFKKQVVPRNFRPCSIEQGLFCAQLFEKDNVSMEERAIAVGVLRKPSTKPQQNDIRLEDQPYFSEKKNKYISMKKDVSSAFCSL